MLKIDFSSAGHNFRRLYGEGKNQPIAKAVGIKKYGLPLKIIDATAGLGTDAFVMACLGCEVTLIERNPQLYQLLKDAISNPTEEISSIVSRMRVLHGNAIDLLPDMQADVIYLDPMFPSRSKSALVKKNMRVLKELVGEDVDQSKLLQPACYAAKRRVVVKRPKGAIYLTEDKPHVSIIGKSSRFDIYMPMEKQNYINSPLDV